MSPEAIHSLVVSTIRQEVPEFEGRFQSELKDEDGEMGSFQAMSAFAAWVLERLHADPNAPEVERSFSVLEHVASSAEFPMGRALVTEFVEAIIGNADAIQRLGPASRAYLSPP